MRMIQKCLLDQIGRNVEAYMDDIVVKSHKGSDLLTDLAQTFANLRRYDIKLNPAKCSFGVPSGKLLGFFVSEQGIEVNPEKIGTIVRMERPVRIHDVQRLTGCLAALSRFISRLGEKALPLYRLMKKSDTFSGQTKPKSHSTTSKSYFPPSRFLLLRSVKNPFFCTSRLQIKSSALFSQSNAKKKAKHTRFSGQCIMSPKS